MLTILNIFKKSALPSSFRAVFGSKIISLIPDDEFANPLKMMMENYTADTRKKAVWRLIEVFSSTNKILMALFVIVVSRDDNFSRVSNKMKELITRLKMLEMSALEIFDKLCHFRCFSQFRF